MTLASDLASSTKPRKIADVSKQLVESDVSRKNSYFGVSKGLLCNIKLLYLYSEKKKKS